MKKILIVIFIGLLFTLNCYSQTYNKIRVNEIQVTNNLDNCIHFNNQIKLSNGTILDNILLDCFVTPGNRTRDFINYSDTIRIPSDTILAGGNRLFIRNYGTDTAVVLNWIEITCYYSTTPYTSAETDSIFIFTKKNFIDSKVAWFGDSHLKSSCSNFSSFPVAVDGKDLGAGYRLDIPNIYTVGDMEFRMRYKYYLVVK